MKKILIALPLVLIMILSMVPVMAAEDLVVNVSYYDTPNKTNVIQTKKVIVPVTDAQAKDAKALKELVEKAVKAEVFPKLNTEVQPEWNVEATVSAQSQGKETYSKLIKVVSDMKFKELIAAAEAYGVKFSYKNITQGQLEDETVVYATAKLFTDIETELDKIVAGDEPAEIELDAANHFSQDPAKNQNQIILEKEAGAITAATASAVAYPKCFVDPKTEEESFCPELCDYITVKVINAFNGKEIVDAAKRYKVEPKKLPTFDGIYNHYINTFFPEGYQILKNWNLQNRIQLPSAINKDCTITIWVLPERQVVDVLHVLKNCCETPDGTMTYPVWKKFVEVGVTVDFIDYHSTFVVDSNKAAEWAATRLQKINATDFVFVRAIFDDGIVLDDYMTGEVYDMNGNKIATIGNTNPTIVLEYLRSECVKEEEQVDNATVENTNTQAPVTASGTQLPATGAKDVTAFFLSAVALLALGIFFAKKH